MIGRLCASGMQGFKLLQFTFTLKVVVAYCFPRFGACHHTELLKAVGGEVDNFSGCPPDSSLYSNVERPIVQPFLKIVYQNALGVILPCIPYPHPSFVEVNRVLFSRPCDRFNLPKTPRSGGVTGVRAIAVH